MKKLFTLFIAVLMVVGMTTAAMAAFQVEVKTNSEPITAAVGACERAGNITFIFDAGTIIKDGDWWIADLPLGVTLCKSMDFVITGAGAPVPGVGGFPVGTTPAVPLDNGTTTASGNGIWSVKDVVNGDGINGRITVAGSQMFFRVTGSTGSNRLTIKAYDSSDVVNGVGGATNINGSSTLTVGGGTEFQIKIFDGNAATGFAYKDNDAVLAPGWLFYGEDANDSLQNAITGNDWDNSYCITVDSVVHPAQTIDVSITSGGVSGNNFLTFNPSNPEVAHKAAASVITLNACKGDLYGYVPLVGGQNATCTYNYNMGTKAGYCSDIFPAAFGGQKLIITNTTGNFFEAGDQYRLVVRISGNGAYFAGAPTLAKYAVFEDACAGAGAAVGLGTIVYGTQTGVPATGFPLTNCLPPLAGSAVVSATSDKFTGIDTSNKLVVTLPAINYVSSMLANGAQTTVTVELQRLPCGMVFSATRIVAQYASLCPSVSPTTTLYYPYAVALNASTGWWFGMTIGNPGAVAGTALITVYEKDGDVGTYTTPSIAAKGLVVLSAADLLSSLTKAPASTGTLGDSAAHIVVLCNFPGAGGFGMMGNGIDSTGYTAYR